MYITTPIFYANSVPHIGHLYTVTIGDVLTRYNSMIGKSVTLTVGVDEHGTKVEEAANNAKQKVEDYCDQIANKFLTLVNEFNINYTKFTRTVDPYHQKGVQHFWKELEKNNCITMGHYSGWYSKADEAFASESEVTKVSQGNNVFHISTTSGHRVEWVEEETHMFQLDKFQNDLKHWLRSGDVVKPVAFGNMLSKWVEDEAVMQPLSISRPAKRVPWAIPVPDNDSHTIYVWLDALVSYLTSQNYPDMRPNIWPPDIQVIGKDILKFHGVYWPALLIAAGLEPPRTLLCHSHWTINSVKMSKSKGNVVCPFDVTSTNNTESLRFYLLSQSALSSDGDFDIVNFKRKVNAEMFGAFLNLAWRCMSTRVNDKLIIPDLANYSRYLDHEKVPHIINLLEGLGEVCANHYEKYKFHHVIESTMKVIDTTNALINDVAPWKMAKQNDVETQNRLKGILSLTYECVRICSLTLHPIIPNTTSALLDTLAVPDSERTWSFTQVSYQPKATSEEKLLHLSCYPKYRMYQ